MTETQAMPGVASQGRGAPPPGYVLFPHVALLDEHELPEENGQPAVKVGPQELRLIAGNGNRRCRETKDATPVTVGHTKDHAKETDQPPVVGYAANFTVGRLGQTNREAVFADLLIRQDWAPAVEEKYQRRSVELWVNRMQVDPICLLGATSPERDLGPLGRPVVRYARSADDTGRKVRCYSPASEGDDMPDETTPPEKDKKPTPAQGATKDGKACYEANGDEGATMGGDKGGLNISPEQMEEFAAMLMKTKPFAQLGELVQLLEEEGAGGEGAQPGAEGEPAMAGAGAQPSGLGAGAGGPPMPPPNGAPESQSRLGAGEPPPVKYGSGLEDNDYGPLQYGGSAASMNNTYGPARYQRPVAATVPPELTKDVAETKASATALAKKLELSEARVAELESRLNGFDRAARYSRRKGQLLAVKADNFLVVADDVLDKKAEKSLALSDDEFEADVVEDVKRNYARSTPAGHPGTRPATGGQRAGHRPQNQAETDAICRLATRRGLGPNEWDKACELFAAGER